MKTLQLEQSFQLLKLFPSSDLASPIECAISEQSMEESKHKYYVLPYTWGATQSKQEIILNGRLAFATQTYTQYCCNLATYLACSEACSIWRVISGLTLFASTNKIAKKKGTKGHMKEIFAGADLVVA